MIFALIDYIMYGLGKGRYDLSQDDWMKWSFREKIPDEILNHMQFGDMVFLFTKSSFKSWAVMYMTNTRFSHVMTYAGDGKIVHATLSRVIESRLSDHFEEGSAFLVCHLPELDQSQEQALSDCLAKMRGKPYSWSDVMLKFRRIATGRDWAYYRWEFFANLATLLLLVDVFVMPVTGCPVFSLLLVPYALIVAYNRCIWSTRPLSLDKHYLKPLDVLRMCIVNGAKICANPQGIDSDGVNSAISISPDSELL